MLFRQYLRPADGSPVPTHADWLERCDIIHSTLKGFLMS